MAVSEEYLHFVIEQLSPLGEIHSRRMFGGVGVYCGGLFFALLDNDRLYLKVDDDNRPAFEAEGLRPFEPWPGHVMAGYFEAPSDALENREALRVWAEGALKAARGAKAKKKPASKKPSARRKKPPARRSS